MRTIRRALGVARSRERGKQNYCDAINSYLGMIKGTSDLKWAVAILDTIQKNGIDKDYKELKINYHTNQ
jgi:hypothetical protein